MSKTTRVQMELPGRSLERLKSLKEKTEASSYAEVTKNAYRLYDKLVTLHEDGCTLLLKNRDGKVRELDIFI